MEGYKIKKIPLKLNRKFTKGLYNFIGEDKLHKLNVNTEAIISNLF